ncbi:hypothetical protein KV557_01365 [Kitasatospora aureofaciens]|uniref:hypothetical protein n=1 Tax=Kitasatospora aureofaciens TaxID=1894 RepID=UPI001C466EDA|nr:hypothetical protein [Kitasatospora aureofaciens]MBV6695772.1 hypothetical protein [Kitasatospora aureofaciens]
MRDDMTNDHLEVGHPARPVAAAALWTSAAGAAAFTVFAYLTTQVHAVRAGSPWQDDPFDTVVTFTLFFVPLLVALGAVRALLCRRDRPLPRYRVEQVLRTALVCTLLVAATLAADWAAVAARADRELWNNGTPWLVASLLPLTGVTAAGLLLHRRTVRLLPGTARGRGDWLDDVVPLVNMLTGRHSRVGRKLAVLIGHSNVLGFVRSRFTALAAAAALAAGLLVATGLASGEGWPGMLLFSVETTVFACGTFAFVVICNGALRFAAPPPTSRVRRAARIATTTGALALPISLALRDTIWQLLGLGNQTDSLGQWAVVTLAGALLTGALTFSVVALGTKE